MDSSTMNPVPESLLTVGYIENPTKENPSRSTLPVNKPSPSRFPQSVMAVSRNEFGEQNPRAKGPRLKLQIKEGSLPTDLQGHVFVIGPAGSVSSPHTPDGTVIPSEDGTTLLYNGDGMIFRFDFDQPETGAFLANRLVTPPCYYADIATHENPQFHGSATAPDLRFESVGVARLGKLGLRNQLNTAFLPMKFANEDQERLLVTWDAGRPYEIDPATLDTVTPIGWNHEWEPVTKIGSLPWQPPTAFETVQTSAHPVFDPQKNGGEMITVNLGRSLSNSFSQLVPIPYLLQELKDWITGREKPPKPLKIDPQDFNEFQHLTHQASPINAPEKETFKDKILIGLGAIWQFLYGLITFFTGNFVDLIVWNGADPFQKWRVTYNGQPIKILQSAHQLAVTEDYIILLDTAFKISIEELLPPLKKRNSRQIEQFLRNVLDHPQLANNHFYIVRRRDLKTGVTTVPAQKIILPLEAAHFLADYKNPNDCLTLHFSHVCAWDAAESISEFDYDIHSENNTAETAFQRLYGIIYSPTDISRLGTLTLQVTATGIQLVRPQKTDIVMDPQLTWGPAIYAYRNGQNYGQPERIDNLYWNCMGCWSELLKPHIEELYEDYNYRQIGSDLLRTIAEEGRPSNLIRLHIDPIEQAQPNKSRVKIADFYQGADTIAIGTPQFIPARGTEHTNDSTAGYLFCVVHQGDGKDDTNGNEIWIFDAANLKQGPLCKLWHPQFNCGFTVHSTWLQQAKERTASYNIPMEQDYKAVLENPKQYPEVRELFQDWIFKQRETQ